MGFWVQYTKMNHPDETEKTKELIKKLLAEHIGVEPEDINDDDSFVEDLHMNPSEVADFAEKLEEAGFETGKIDFMALESVEDMALSLEK